ncbi:MAG: CRISPR-associated endonuclease Cas2 [Alphaproteobacteria bacterium]|nr:CRISPR-associated endonuclease Cas2 [Alphaproteobacteria bacterium]
MKEEKRYLNGRKLMWMMVMFDLPTDTSVQRKSASKFRKFLLDTGFEMVQFSVYTQFTGTWESSQKYVNNIKENTPKYGDINILFFTDKQFENIIHIENLKEEKLREKPNQFELF